MSRARHLPVWCYNLHDALKRSGTVSFIKWAKRKILKNQKNQCAQINSLQDTVALLSGCLDELENRSRRNSLIIKGIPEKNEKTWNYTKKTVRNFFRSERGLNIGDIERTHRLGHQKAGFNRPILVRLLNFKNKQEVFFERVKVKGAKWRTKSMVLRWLLCEDAWYQEVLVGVR